MNERHYKGFTLGQYYRNGTKQKWWYVELNGEECSVRETLWSAKDYADQHQHLVKEGFQPDV